MYVYGTDTVQPFLAYHIHYSTLPPRAGIGRDLVVVVDDIPTQSAKIGEDTPSSREVEDLNRGRAFVRNLLEAGGSVLATGVEEGIRASANVRTPVSQ